MKKFSLIVALLTAVTMLVSCGDDNNGANPVAERTIVYAIDTDMSRAALKTDAEWDELLDRFCSSAIEGHTITFCNANGATTAAKQVKAGPRAGRLSADGATTITTTSRDEIKSWMKEMEKKGKTVTVTYNDNNGTWTGTAYATAPQTTVGPTHGCYTGVLTVVPLPTFSGPQLQGKAWAISISADSTIILAQGESLMGWSTEHGMDDSGYLTLVIEDGLYNVGDSITLCGMLAPYTDINGNEVLVLDLTSVDESMIVGRWHYTNLSTTFICGDANYFLCGLTNTDIEAEIGSIYFDFHADGTVSYTQSGTTNTTRESTWSLSDDGELCCELFTHGGGCWLVSIANDGTMRLERADFGTEEGDYYYTMQLEKAA